MQTDLAGTVAWALPRRSRPQPSQTDLIRAIAQGDKHAMQALFAQHRLRVYRFALRLIDDKDAAEDLVSEVFLEVWRHAGRFEGRCRVSTWLLAITRNRRALDAAPATDGKIGLRRGRGNPGSCGRSRDRDPEATAECDSCALPDQAVSRASRGHRPRLLPRTFDRRGRGDHSRSAEHREDPHVLRPQPDRTAPRPLRPASDFPGRGRVCLQAAGTPRARQGRRSEPSLVARFSQIQGIRALSSR